MNKAERIERRKIVEQKKTIPFSADEIAKYRIKSCFLPALQRVSQRKIKKDIKILDVGCGRGDMVAFLRREGFQAFGLEASPIQVDIARQGMQRIDEDPAIIVELDRETERYPFSNETFDLVFSDNVVEHVSHAGKLFSEIARVMASDGESVHIFPSKWKIIEPHIFVPFVHWLPKKQWRKTFLWAARILGTDARWLQYESSSAREAVDGYYTYLESSTYYRSIWSIKSACSNAGLLCETSLTDHTVIDRMNFSHDSILRNLSPVAGFLSLLFYTSILELRKA